MPSNTSAPIPESPLTLLQSHRLLFCTRLLNQHCTYGAFHDNESYIVQLFTLWEPRLLDVIPNASEIVACFFFHTVVVHSGGGGGGAGSSQAKIGIPKVPTVRIVLNPSRSLCGLRHVSKNLR